MSPEKYRLIYFATLVASILLISFSRFLQIANLEFWASISVVIWMFVLGYLTYQKSQDNFDESDADYYYYYGFILTLVTLAATFVPFVFSESRVSKESIIGGFGLGLITTFVGLTGRVLLYQQFERLTSGTETAVQTIGIVSNKFARELSTLTSSMTSSLEDLSKSYRDSTSHIQSATETLASEVDKASTRIRGLSDVVEQTRVNLSESGAKLSENLGADSRACANALSSIADSGQSLSASLAKLQQHVERIQAGPIADRSAEIVITLGQLNTAMGVATEAMQGSASDVKQSFGSFTGSVDSAGSKFIELSGSLGEASKELAGISSNYVTFNDTLKLSADAMKSASNSTIGATGAMKIGFDDAIDSIRKLSISVKPLVTELEALQSVLSKERESLRQYDFGVDAITKSLSSASSQLVELAGQLNAGKRRFDKIGTEDLGSLELAIRKLTGTFDNVAGELGVLAAQISNTAADIASLKEQQRSLWEAQLDVQKMVSETHAALLSSLRSIREEIR